MYYRTEWRCRGVDAPWYRLRNYNNGETLAIIQKLILQDKDELINNQYRIISCGKKEKIVREI